MAKNPQSNQALLDLSEAFFRHAFAGLVRGGDELAPAIGSGSFHMQDGAVFAISEDAHTALRSLIRECLAVLGPTAANEKDLQALAWKQARSHLDEAEDPKTCAKEFLKNLRVHAATESEHILPNRLVRLDDAVSTVDIGPVSIIRGENIAAEFNKSHTDYKFRLFVDKEQQFLSRDDFVHASIFPICWRVKLRASPGNIEEEARWQINIATSILRLFYDEIPAFFPGIGELEAAPSSPTDGSSGAVTLRGSTVSAHGWKLAHFYVVDEKLAKALKRGPFGQTVETIFDAPKSSLGERVHQGLGWLSRARQTSDRAERFLFFFTGVEALLSASDITAPVVQTVCRNAAVMLNSDPSKRAKIIDDLAKLYRARSALVHSGKRNVSKSDVDQLQSVAEALYWLALHRCDLKVNFTDFQKELGRAGLGLPWPPGS